ncbi:hypothetical protein [Nonomuraea sp. NPDC049141]|uniref:hypothetical protein n=1 Tax=Nonomuraea sp. NPDC049141 TaxID=3155500 RepID=UPI0033DDECA9
MIVKITLATAVIAALPMAAASRCAPESPAGASSAGPACSPSSKTRASLNLNKEQADNAVAVIRVAADMGLPERATVIAIATTLQESDLDSSVVGDGGLAIGIFQQHPSWGRNRTDPAASAKRFYSRLVKVNRWQTRPLTEAAQAVQRSAYPNAYAKHETRAERIVAKLTTCTEAR